MLRDRGIVRLLRADDGVHDLTLEIVRVDIRQAGAPILPRQNSVVDGWLRHNMVSNDRLFLTGREISVDELRTDRQSVGS